MLDAGVTILKRTCSLTRNKYLTCSRIKIGTADLASQQVSHYFQPAVPSEMMNRSNKAPKSLARRRRRLPRRVDSVKGSIALVENTSASGRGARPHAS